MRFNGGDVRGHDDGGDHGGGVRSHDDGGAHRGHNRDGGVRDRDDGDVRDAPRKNSRVPCQFFSFRSFLLSFVLLFHKL